MIAGRRKMSLFDQRQQQQQQHQGKSDRWTSHLMRNIVKVKTIIPTERWRRYLEILITLYRIVRTNWTWGGGVKSASSHGLIDWHPSEEKQRHASNAETHFQKIDSFSFLITATQYNATPLNAMQCNVTLIL